MRLSPQPFQVLTLLLQHAGQLVMREDIQRELWGDDVSVEFDAGLNRCIRQLRAALEDDADAPRYIETVPRKGYRFIAAVSQVQVVSLAPSDNGGAETLAAALSADNKEPTSSSLRERGLPEIAVSSKPLSLSWWIWLAFGATVVLATMTFMLWPRASGSKTRLDLDAVPLANAPGDQYSPSFSPDGREITFTWNGEPQGSFNIYRKLIGSPNILRLTSGQGIDYSPAWSPDGRWIAFCRGKQQRGGAIWLIPPLGGPERKLVELDAIVCSQSAALSL